MVYEIGTDINSQWEFHDGDLVLISNDENLRQAVYNRITCYIDVFQYFYNEYGSVLMSYFGHKKNNTTLEFMKIELERVLLQDPRIQDFELNIEYVPAGVRVDLTIKSNGTNVDMNFVTDGNNIINEDEVQ